MDCIITITLCLHLRSNRKGTNRSVKFSAISPEYQRLISISLNHMIDSLVLYTFETGTLTRQVVASCCPVFFSADFFSQCRGHPVHDMLAINATQPHIFSLTLRHLQAWVLQPTYSALSNESTYSLCELASSYVSLERISFDHLPADSLSSLNMRITLSRGNSNVHYDESFLVGFPELSSHPSPLRHNQPSVSCL